MEELLTPPELAAAGERMHRLIADLYPICRSITGDGVRQTLRCLGERIPLEIHEVPTGTQVFDWTVPREWNLREAWVRNLAGEKVIDSRKSNLHVVGYSVPLRRTMPLAELREHLHTLPDRPEWIPYRTSYYEPNWGFCLAASQLARLREEEYEVCIDSSLQDGSLTYGEYYLPGRRTDEVLFSCHICHPSMCNDNLSGVSLVASLAELLRGVTLEYSYRFLFVPGTIGAITWLARNENRVSRIRHGLVVACVGSAARFDYKRSRGGNAEIDRSVIHALKHSGEPYEARDFSPYGFDERQYCSPGINLEVGCLTRAPHGSYPENHTSADDLDFVRPQALSASLRAFLSIVRILENNARFVNLSPKCEPQLGKRGLYRAIGGLDKPGQIEMGLLWVLNYCDGSHTLLDIAERAGLAFDVIHRSAQTLVDHQLLCPVAPGVTCDH